MSESEEKRRKREKKEKKARKEKKRDKAAAAAPSNASAARRQGLEEVFEDDDEFGAQRGHSRGQSERYDDAADDDEDGPRHSLSGGSNQRGLSGLAAAGAPSSRRAHGHHNQQHLDMDDLDGRGGGNYDDGDGDDDGGQQGNGRHNVRLHGGMELDDGLDGQDDDQERLDLDGADGMDDAAELDLDYHPPPPKTGQQVALAGVALFGMGAAEMFTFAYMCTASEVWSLVVSAAMLLIVGSLGLRAASEGTILSATYYRISLQVYMMVLLVLAGMNVLFLQMEPCIAPCVSTDPARCVQPDDATVTCSHVLVNTLAVSVFGLFFPCFLFLLPCYLGSGIHLENLTSQAVAAGPNGQKQERQGLMYREDSERKY